MDKMSDVYRHFDGWFCKQQHKQESRSNTSAVGCSGVHYHLILSAIVNLVSPPLHNLIVAFRDHQDRRPVHQDTSYRYSIGHVPVDVGRQGGRRVGGDGARWSQEGRRAEGGDDLTGAAGLILDATDDSSIANHLARRGVATMCASRTWSLRSLAIYQ